MERMEFSVQGSEVDPYRVTVEKIGQNLNAYCTCAAGAKGQYCKHRFRILSGNPEGLINAEVEHLRAAVDWLVGTDMEIALQNLAKAEDLCESAKRALADAKKRLARAFLQ